MSVVAPPPHDELELLIREARARQRKRRAVAVAVVAVLAGASVAISAIVGTTAPSASTGGGKPVRAAVGTSRCGVTVEGVRILEGDRLVYREPVSRTFGHQIECSGSTVWVVFFNGVGMSQEAYFGVRSADRGRSWKVVFAERYFNVKAPHQLVTGYLGPWALDGPRAAYFVGWCVACGAGTSSLWVTNDGGRTFRSYPVPVRPGRGPISIRVPGHTVTVTAHRVRIS